LQKLCAKTLSKYAVSKISKLKFENTPLHANPDLVLREEGQEALLFDPNTGSIKVLNYVGKTIWKLLNGKNTEKSIRERIAKKFKDADPKLIRKDVNEFLNKLEGYGYLGKEL